MAKAFLDKHGVPYESIDVGADTEAARKMIDLSGQRGVPVIVVDNEVIVGFDSERLNALSGSHLPVTVTMWLLSVPVPQGSLRESTVPERC